ncbi:MAG TPA: ornithine carbamoyltransferase [Alphaproteobacteria bacterium]|nr:ornithine carbamoyltransferase [Alphaproteobacteria bacterium]
MTETRHFLDLSDIPGEVLRAILADSVEMKRANGSAPRPLAGKTLAMIFEKPSTRTRVSFEVGMRQLGGDVIVMDQGSMQLGRGETVADTARVLSRYVDIIMIRTSDHTKLLELAEHATVPVINGLTDRSHPCQVMADVMTFEEHRGPIGNRTVAWAGDCNNVFSSWVHAAAKFGFRLNVASPEPLHPSESVRRWAQDHQVRWKLTEDPDEAVAGADAIVTDTWVSMHNGDAAQRHNMLTPYQITPELMGKAANDAVFMHCLPAHRGEEVTAEVIDGLQSVVWDEAENRLHIQKGILAWCLA